MPSQAGGARKSTRSGKASRAAFREQCAAANTPCWMDGMPIDYEAAWDDWTNDDRFQVDHFFPVSTHPELQDDPDNYRASHAGCNVERSNNAATAPLGELSQAFT